MREKPQKPSKQSKKDKEKEVSEESLTPKQLKEKRREEARARAAESRKIVAAGVSQWTGKLPGQLLNEHAQKMKWERVEYIPKSFGKDNDQQWIVTVVLARRNPKSKEIEKVRFDPPANRISKQPTQLEARHLAATYAMHRVLSHRNMKMMLPPMHRDLWDQLDSDKASANGSEKYLWSEDPWQAQKDSLEMKKKIIAERKEREARRDQMKIVIEAQNEHNNTKDESSNAGEGPKDDAQKRENVKRVRFNNSLVMTRKTQSMIEKILREHHGFQFDTKNALDQTKFPEQYKKLSSMLEKLGFFSPFVREALEYTSTLSSALAWLLIHVPEDDVPKSFMPADLGITARISSNMAIENATAKLKSLGYSEEVARSVAEECEGNVPRGIIKLTRSFLDSDPVDVGASMGEEESLEMWQEEMESLLAVLDEKDIKVNSENRSCHIISRQLKAKFGFYWSENYPNVVPGVTVEPLVPGAFSKVTQLEATRRAAVYAQSNLVGDFMIMALFHNMEDIFESIRKSPVKLSQLSTAIVGVKESRRANKRQRNDDERRLSRLVKSLKFNPEEVLQERDRRMNTEEGKKLLSSRANLPAWNKKKEIVELVEQHQVTLITGETGSGKSTQVVQFILDSSPSSQIICTQPRRISAIGVAQRVAEERLTDVGDQVGYVIRGEKKVSTKTQLKFVTSGVLLRMLQGFTAKADGSEDDTTAGINGVTHIVVDEVHERSLDGDFLLILLKRLLKKIPSVKIILMSATVDPKQFFDYFSKCEMGYAHIPGRTFPVKEYFLDDVIKLTGYRPASSKSNSSPAESSIDDSENDPTGNEDAVGRIIGAIRANNPGSVDYQLVAAVIEHIHSKLDAEGENQGSILIFLSGAAEIDRALRAISETSVGKALWLLPLHAALPPSEQKKVFQKAPRGLRKVVATTNVAETSITITDVVAVVDTGRAKETVYDSSANVTRLVDSWISQASAAQRKGRAGRVRAGDCYKLYTRNSLAKMPPEPTPEILRCPLEVLYLNVKAMGISSVEAFLSQAIDPPHVSSLDKARESLITYGALDPISNELTSLGRHISLIPTDPRTAKLLVLGSMMGCLSSCLTVAAILSGGKLPFSLKRDDEDSNTRLKKLFGYESGDLLAACEAFEQYRNGSVDKSFIIRSVCRDIQNNRRQMLSSLVQTGFVDPSVIKNGKENLPDELTRFDLDKATVRATISAALIPNLVEIVYPAQKYMATSAGSVHKEGIEDSRQLKFIRMNGERVFIHPRSLLFGAKSFEGGAKYMSYGSDIVTTKHFISELTPLSVYGLILFASRIGVDPLGNGLIIDKWTGLKCWPRAGILLQFLQQAFGSLMDEKLNDPMMNVIDHPVVQLAHDLIESEGKPQSIGMLA